MVSNTATVSTEYFDSSDLYFQPDPAVLNPRDYSPHSRFRSFLSAKRWQSPSNSSRNPLKAGNHHLNGHTHASQTNNRYFFTSTTASDHRLSESLASLAPTSTSSSEEDAEDCKQGDECSLSYSVASSDRHVLLPFEEDEHQYLTNTPNLLRDSSIYEDAEATGSHSLLLVPDLSEPSYRDDVKRKDGCFQSFNGDMDCLHPLAWLGNAFQLLIGKAERRTLEEEAR